MPHLISGDFDSITSEVRSYFDRISSETQLIINSNQETTDLTKTLNLIVQASTIVILLITIKKF